VRCRNHYATSAFVEGKNEKEIKEVADSIAQVVKAEIGE